MSVFDYLCGCFSRDAIIDYLSSSRLNRQVIQQQKCMEDYDQKSQSIYQQSKAKSYMFKQLPDSDQEDQNNKKASKIQISKQEKQKSFVHKRNKIFQSYSIDKSQIYEVQERFDQENYPFKLIQIKLKILNDILYSDVNDDPNYSKIFDSQDEQKLKIFSKSQMNLNGKRINVYRFRFIKLGKKLQEALQKFTKNEEKLRQQLLQSKQVIRTIKQQKQIAKKQIQNQYKNEVQNQNQQLQKKQKEKKPKIQKQQQFQIQLVRRLYKKVLVVNQHEFITAQKAFKQDKKIIMISCSLDIEETNNKKPKPGFLRGWSNLVGLQIKLQNEGQDQCLFFNGYINVQLDSTVNPNMLKQPVIKQLRHYIQNLICQLEGSDGI